MVPVLVIGGGVGGMATAIALRHAGREVVVYEAYPAAADGRGAFLTLMSNGLDALAAIEAEHLVHEHSFVSRRVSMSNGRGLRLGVLDIPTPSRMRAPRTMRRADLYRVLSEEAIRRGVTVAYGKRLTEAHQDATDRVTATFADGTHTHGSLLIGADGAHSTTRELIDPDAPRPAYTGRNIVFGTVAHVPHAVSHDSYYMYFGQRANCGHTTSPDGETLWFANIPCGEHELADLPPAQLRGRLTELFAGDRIPTLEAIAATSNEQITAAACYELATVPTWHNAGMTLVGDALHVASPATTQGASMAIEDAVVLAKCLRDLPNSPQAFRTYERLRRARVERVVASVHRGRGPARSGRMWELMRDLAVARRARRPDVDWLHLHHIDWASQVC